MRRPLSFPLHRSQCAGRWNDPCRHHSRSRSHRRRMERFRWISQSFLGGDEEQEEDPLGEFPDAPCSLSPLQRLYGFAASLVVGFVFMMVSLIVFYKPIKFALLFIFGNILAIGSTAFLIGPVQQARMMLDPVRVYATIIYVGSVVLALVCALCIHSKILTLISMISEICALVWYSLSYVPFARRLVSELLISCCDTEI